jgi:uncharacterized OsmC-like protein
MSEKPKIEQMEFDIDLKQKEHPFQFEVDFNLPVDKLIVDESPDIGDEIKGPDASQLLGSAIGLCLSASLVFCLRKSRLNAKDLTTKVHGVTQRNEDGYWRIKSVQVEISPSIEPEEIKKIERCKEIFERYCIVTASVRQGIPVQVKLV